MLRTPRHRRHPPRRLTRRAPVHDTSAPARRGPVAAVDRTSSARYHTCAPMISPFLFSLFITPISKPTNSTGVYGATPSPGFREAATPTFNTSLLTFPNCRKPATNCASHFGTLSAVTSCSVPPNTNFGSTDSNTTPANVAA